MMMSLHKQGCLCKITEKGIVKGLSTKIFDNFSLTKRIQQYYNITVKKSESDFYPDCLMKRRDFPTECILESFCAFPCIYGFSLLW